MRFLITILVLGLTAPAGAEPLMIPAERMLDVEIGDFNGDGGMDRALLVQGEEDADLLIFLGDLEREGPQLALTAHALAWSGHMFGTLPSLERAPHGSLLVISENAAIGRNRWRETLTVAYRGARFRVAGYDYHGYDTLDPGAAQSCTVNLLTGRGEANGEGFSFEPRRVPVEEWSPDALPPECRF